jgi:hypothetical protein
MAAQDGGVFSGAAAKAGLASPMNAINAPLAIHFISLLPSVD